MSDMKTMKKTPNETRKFTKHLGEKTNCPQPAWNLCSGYIPYSNVDTNGFLHLHEMPGKILGQNNNKKPKERSKQTNKKSPHKIQTNNPTRKEGRRHSFVWHGVFLVAWYKLELPSPQTGFLPTQCRLH